MKGLLIVLVAIVAISSATGSTYSTTKTDDIQGIGEFQPMVLLAGQAPGNCYACSAPCAVAGKGCCSNTIYKQCRQIDGVACRCTQR